MGFEVMARRFEQRSALSQAAPDREEGLVGAGPVRVEAPDPQQPMSFGRQLAIQLLREIRQTIDVRRWPAFRAQISGGTLAAQGESGPPVLGIHMDGETVLSEQLVDL